MRVPKRLSGLLLLLSILGLSACSKIEIVYRLAPNLLTSQADKYFDLSSDQRKKTKEIIHNELQALVRDEVPNLTQYLTEALTFINKKELSRATFDAFQNRSHTFSMNLISHLEPSVIEFLLLLNPKQFEYYEKKFKEVMEEKENKLKSTEAQQKQLKKRFEFWFDFIDLDLNSEQESAFHLFLKQSNYPFDLERKNQAELQEKFVASASNPKTLKKFIHKLFLDPLSFRSPEFKQAYVAYQGTLRDYQFGLIRSLNDEQKKRIGKKLGTLIEQLSELRKNEILSTQPQLNIESQ
jgi:hypothetical protein